MSCSPNARALAHVQQVTGLSRIPKYWHKRRMHISCNTQPGHSKHFSATRHTISDKLGPMCSWRIIAAIFTVLLAHRGCRWNCWQFAWTAYEWLAHLRHDSFVTFLLIQINNEHFSAIRVTFASGAKPCTYATDWALLWARYFVVVYLMRFSSLDRSIPF